MDDNIDNGKNSTEDKNDTRIVISVEQMIPYLENLCKVNDNEVQDDTDPIVDEFEVPTVLDNRPDVDPLFFILKKKNRHNREVVNAMLEQRQTEPFDDYTDLNPIIEAINVLQTDELVEGIYYIYLFGFFLLYAPKRITGHTWVNTFSSPADFTQEFQCDLNTSLSR